MGRGGQGQSTNKVSPRTVDEFFRDRKEILQSLSAPMDSFDPEQAKEYLLGHLKQGKIYQKHALRRSMFSNLVREHINLEKGIDHTLYALNDPEQSAEVLLDSIKQQALALDSPRARSGRPLLDDDQRYMIEIAEALRDPAIYPEPDPDDFNYNQVYFQEESEEISQSERKKARTHLRNLLNQDRDLGPVYQPLIKAARGEDLSKDAARLVSFLRDFETEFQAKFPNSHDGYLSDHSDQELTDWCRDLFQAGGNQLKQLADM